MELAVGSGNSGYRIGNGHATSGSRDDGYRTVRGFTTRLNPNAQGKHIPSHKNYDKNQKRSIFKGSLEHAQALIESKGGAGEWHSPNKETINFGETIGTWISSDGNTRLETTRGTIHYGKNGAHIVPAHPEGTK